MLLEKAVSVLWKRHQRARTSKKRTPLSLGDSTHFLCHISLIKCPPLCSQWAQVWCVRICCEAINGSPFTSAVDWRVNRSTVSQWSTNKSGHARDVPVDSKHAFVEIIARELSAEPQRNLLGRMGCAAWVGYGNCVTAT
jgi:hypothetical protein